MLDILRDNIRDDYGESRCDRMVLPEQAVDNATPESLRAFLQIHEELTQLVDRSHIRTRYTGPVTPTGDYGLSYYRSPIISKAANRTNQSSKQFVSLRNPSGKAFYRFTSVDMTKRQRYR